MQRHLTGSQIIELGRLSFAGRIALALASITTFVLHGLLVNVMLVNA
jgi:hypothetical protein